MGDNQKDIMDTSEDNQKEIMDTSDLGASLQVALAALNENDRVNLVSALKVKLQYFDGQKSEILESLTPMVRKRVEFLIELQTQHNELEAKFDEEKAALELKYQKLYEPLYAKRYDIVNGVTEVDGVKNEATVDQKGDKETEEKGVPNFWSISMKTHDLLSEEIKVRDEEALNYLKDIKLCMMDDPNDFKLEFFFDTNPFFKNEVLTKTYQIGDKPMMGKTIGTEIEWFPGKCLTQKIVKRKPKKGSNEKPLTVKTKNCQSFFKFFNPPQFPDLQSLDMEKAEEIHYQMELDYDVGLIIRDKIIPHAVSWFTGEAEQDVEFDFNSDEDEDDRVHDHDDDDDEDEDDDKDDNDEEEEAMGENKK
ncbi:nucleosome assembly protein 1;4-like [Impatiens glandulifera]|uniref:nucleosome assembly protein 1;4-like n=1 Tax=Impatiens glandulifera TaxID=253017 RepID=UPI001FB078E0|nr:nucleosome assembly protein 1;4-like [Impatiens glandulifera]